MREIISLRVRVLIEYDENQKGAKASIIKEAKQDFKSFSSTGCGELGFFSYKPLSSSLIRKKRNLVF